MAKDGSKFSTASRVSHALKLLRANDVARSKASKRLADQLKSAEEVRPASLAELLLDPGPEEDEVFVMPHGGTVILDGRARLRYGDPPPPVPTPSQPEEARGAKVWVAAEARRMKKAGEPPPNIKISEFARTLAERMRKAAARDHTIHRVGWKHIKNNLRKWGLWPVSGIK